MKETYFTIQAMDQQARDLYQQVAEINPIKAWEFHPSQSALLVLDMQSYFMDPSSHAYIPSAGAIVDGILQLIDAYHVHQQPIFFTRHINTLDNAGMMSVWWKDLITSENRLHQIIPEIDTSMGICIDKSQYDAFYQTPLEDLLRAKAVTQVVLCGVMTHLCCETSARSAFMRGFGVLFPVDGTATYNLAYHKASLLNLPMVCLIDFYR
jgi:isochorismate hydrolase